MVFQQTNYTCGPASVLNAFRCLGITIKTPEKEMARLCGTSVRHGTDEFDLAGAVILLGHDVGKTSKREHVEYYVSRGHPVLLVAYKDTHWVLVAGMLGPDRWVIIDPDNGSWNKRENGVHIRHPDELMCGEQFSGVAVLGEHKRLKATSRSRRAKTNKRKARS